MISHFSVVPPLFLLPANIFLIYPLQIFARLLAKNPACFTEHDPISSTPRASVFLCPALLHTALLHICVYSGGSCRHARPRAPSCWDWCRRNCALKLGTVPVNTRKSPARSTRIFSYEAIARDDEIIESTLAAFVRRFSHAFRSPKVESGCETCLFGSS